MSFANLLTDAVTIVNPVGPVTDDFGDAQPDWGHAMRVETRGFLDQTNTNEVRDGRDTVLTDGLLFLDIGENLTSSSRVEVGGGTYEVVGQPATPRQHHIEAHLRKVD